MICWLLLVAAFVVWLSRPRRNPAWVMWIGRVGAQLALWGICPRCDGRLRQRVNMAAQDCPLCGFRTTDFQIYEVWR